MDVSGLLLDLDGTVYVGDAALPGAVEALRSLTLPRRFLTNTTRVSRVELVGRLRAMGLDIAEAELFTAPVAAARWLEREGISRVALYLPASTHADFAAFDRAADRPEAVVVGDLGEGWDFATLNRAFRQLMDGACLVALQKNRYWRTAGGLTLDAGPFVAALEHAAAREAVVVGKPAPSFFALALDALGLPPERVAAVGDDVEADVAGAQAAGLRGVLVRTGKFREEGLRESGVRPDAVLDSLADLPGLLA